MILLLLQGLPPFQLGPYGSGGLFLVTAALAIITWRQRIWKSTAESAIAEMNVHKETGVRLRNEKEDYLVEKQSLLTKIGKLETQTDLRPLIDAVTSWVSEGRLRFEEAQKKLDVIQTEQTSTLKEVIEEVRSQRIASETGQTRFLAMMDSVERRLTTIAVRVGVDQWELDAPVMPHPAETKAHGARAHKSDRAR